MKTVTSIKTVTPAKAGAHTASSVLFRLLSMGPDVRRDDGATVAEKRGGMRALKPLKPLRPHPRQARLAPPADALAVSFRILVAFETLQDIERILIAPLGRHPRRVP